MIKTFSSSQAPNLDWSATQTPKSCFGLVFSVPVQFNSYKADTITFPFHRLVMRCSDITEMVGGMQKPKELVPKANSRI